MKVKQFIYLNKIKKISDMEKAAYFSINIPMLADREVYLNGYGVNNFKKVDRLDYNGTVLIVA